MCSSWQESLWRQLYLMFFLFFRLLCLRFLKLKAINNFFLIPLYDKDGRVWDIFSIASLFWTQTCCIPEALFFTPLQIQHCACVLECRVMAHPLFFFKHIYLVSRLGRSSNSTISLACFRSELLDSGWKREVGYSVVHVWAVLAFLAVRQLKLWLFCGPPKI